MCSVSIEFLEFLHPSFYYMTVFYDLVRFTLYPLVFVITRINFKCSSSDVIKELHFIAHCDIDKESNRTSGEERYFCQSHSSLSHAAQLVHSGDSCKVRVKEYYLKC